MLGLLVRNGFRNHPQYELMFEWLGALFLGSFTRESQKEQFPVVGTPCLDKHPSEKAIP